MKKIRKIEIPMTAELRDILLNQLEEFKKKFGRDPLPGDPVCFDPDCDTPTPLSEEKLKKGLIEAANEAGIDASRVLKHFGFDIDDESSNICKKKHKNKHN